MKLYATIDDALGFEVGWELIFEVLQSIFGQIFEDEASYGALAVYDAANKLAENGYYRTEFTSALISRFRAYPVDTYTHH